MAETAGAPAQDNTSGGEPTDKEGKSSPTEAQVREGTLVTDEEEADESETGDKEGDSEGDEGDKGSKEEGAPETYADFTMPEGMETDEGVLGKFTGVAKELNLTQEQAQKLIDISAENAKALMDKQREVWRETREKWVASIKTDKEFGGSKYAETLAYAKRTIREFGTTELKTFLTDTGYGDNPDLIKFLAKAGKALSDDRLVEGKAPSLTKSPAEKMYN